MLQTKEIYLDHFDPFGYEKNYYSMTYSEFTGIHLSMALFWRCLLV